MIAIKGMGIPKTCYECSLRNIRYYTCCSLIFSDRDCGRHPDCPLVEIVTCKDCKHRDPEDKFCDCGHKIKWSSPREDDWYCADAER